VCRQSINLYGEIALIDSLKAYTAKETRRDFHIPGFTGKGYGLSQQISKPTTLPELRDYFPKTAKVFDWLGYLVQRTEQLVWASKYLIFGSGFLLFLIYELAHFAKYLLKNWN